jgi:transposase
MKICSIISAMMKPCCLPMPCIQRTRRDRRAVGHQRTQRLRLNTSGRQRLNIHGAIDLETGATRMIEATTIDALSTIALLMAITLMYPTKRLIHVFVDNARYHHAVLVQEWLAKPGCRIKVHYIPSYCPHLDPIERLWGLMHRHVTHNRSHPSYNDFCRAILHFLREEVPKNWAILCDSVTDQLPHHKPCRFSGSQGIEV